MTKFNPSGNKNWRHATHATSSEIFMDKYFLQKSGDLIYVAHYFKARRLSEGVSWRPHIYEQGIKSEYGRIELKHYWVT